jgi:hypothetical protein
MRSFFWELQYLFLQQNLKSFQNICEANLQKKIRLLFYNGIVEKRSRDRINEK